MFTHLARTYTAIRDMKPKVILNLTTCFFIYFYIPQHAQVMETYQSSEASNSSQVSDNFSG